MLQLAHVITGVMLAFTIIAILCARKLSQPRVTHFGCTARRPNAGSGRFLLPSTRTAARTLATGGAHVVGR